MNFGAGALRGGADTALRGGVASAATTGLALTPRAHLAGGATTAEAAGGAASGPEALLRDRKEYGLKTTRKHGRVGGSAPAVGHGRQRQRLWSTEYVIDVVQFIKRAAQRLHRRRRGASRCDLRHNARQSAADAAASGRRRRRPHAAALQAAQRTKLRRKAACNDDAARIGALKVTSATRARFFRLRGAAMAARLRPRCLRELAQRLSRSCATAAADAPPPPLAAAAQEATKRPPRTPIDAEIVSHARQLRVDPHLFSGASSLHAACLLRLAAPDASRAVMMLTAESRQCCGYGRLFPKRTALRFALCTAVDSHMPAVRSCAALLVRFVAATDADGVAWVVPDASGRLPGRGAYTLASHRAVDLAVTNSALPLAASRPISRSRALASQAASRGR